ncbi:sugar ABC transporter permease [Alicyclobacillus cellulosilyticus]|uniref:Sugar ABC transporter permease n=1 Tax=Alicyclobacillus cellulosilyticus TaxID=1003997 RepID=A0A917KGG8_9BACL|nr:carbohydrate ABC transporter permease [Alicyclobacillus cellulosilyticus]GGJ10786.1 sugar ABC transporter permease [Alicyclobacillus cellulosilyticus]
MSFDADPVPRGALAATSKGRSTARRAGQASSLRAHRAVPASVRQVPAALLAVLLVLYVAVPFVWMVVTSLKPAGEVLSPRPQWIPHPVAWINYVVAWRSAPFGRYFLNSFFISACETVFDLTLGAMAAYALARMEFYGKRLVFLVLLATWMVPGEVMLIPNYLTISRLHWVNTYAGLMVPWLVSVFTILLMTQYFRALPRELFEAAETDGCSPVRTLFQVVLPASKPVWVTAGLIKFIGTWNAFLWVVVVANQSSLFTLPVGLFNFSGDAGTQYHLLMAAATFSMAPLLVLFVFGQRYIVEGIARTGLK